MADQNISQILAALASQRNDGAHPNAPQPPMQQMPMGQPPYQAAYPTPPPPAAASNFSLPQPTSSGNVDLTNAKSPGSGSVSLAEAVARARGIASSRGVSMDQGRGPQERRSSRRSRSRSRSPRRAGRDSFRDGYNPYREERRDERRSSGYAGDRGFSPAMGHAGGPGYGNPAGDSGMETVTIESHLVGLIIGRSGENLRRVEAETGARVQFLTGPEATGPHRPCKISGPLATRNHAKAELARIISENGKTSSLGLMASIMPPVGGPGLGPGFGQGPGPGPGPGPGRGSGASTPMRGPGPGQESTQMMVPNRTVGLIIGRGGETIRDLQERSGCHVNIVGEDKAVSNLRPVNLIGTREQAAIAKELILEIVDSDSRGQTVNGPPPIRQPVMTSTGRSDTVGERVNDSITVPSEAVGMIIGKGGETIREMQNMTGAKINVSQPAGPDVEREIGLIGTYDSIEAAKRAIREKAEAVLEKNRGGGRANGPQYDQYGSGGSGYSGQGGYGQPSYDQYQQPQQPGPQGGPQGGQPQQQGADPYAAYGGYENYMALWYSHYNQGQAQQQPQGQ